MTQDNLPNDPNQPKNVPNAGDQTGGPGAPTPPTPTTPAPHKRRWLRLTLFVVGGLIIVLLIIALLIPTIASTGWVRGIVVNKINQNLNGHVQIADWSIGWTGGIRLDGVKVFDDQNRQILEIPHVSTQLSLLNAARGNYAIGQTVVDGLDFDAIRYPDGTLNFQHLQKTSSAAPQQGKPTAENPAPAQPSKSEPKEAAPAKAEPSQAKTKLPNVSGELKLVNCRGTVETIAINPTTHQEQHEMVKFTSIQGDVKIPNINQPISDSLQVAETGGSSGATPGTLDVNGQILIAQNNELLSSDKMSGQQNVAMSTIELAGFAPFAPPSITTLGGNTSGKLSLTLNPGQGDVIDGQITSSNFKLGGPILSGDTYAAQSAVITIPKTTATFIAGSSDLDHIRTGDGSQPITIALTNAVQNGKASQSAVKLTIDASANALQNIAASKKPGSNGVINADADLDLVPLAQMLPHMLHLFEGIKLDSGRLTNGLNLKLSPDHADIQQALSIANVAGTDPHGKPVKLDPINQTFKATDLGGNSGIPDLRDMALTLTTNSDPNAGWASANVTAPNIGKLQGQIHAVLERAQAELGQFVDFGTVKLAGNLDVALTSNGDLVGDEKADASQPLTSDIGLKTVLINLKIDGLNDTPPVNEPFIGFNMNATLVRPPAQARSELFIQAIHNLNTQFLTGDQAHPSVNGSLAGNLDLSQKPAADGKGAPQTLVSTKDLAYTLHTDLPAVQREFGAFLKSLAAAHLTIQSGQTNLTGHASYDGHTASLPDLAMDATGINLVKQAGTAAPENVLNNYNLTLRTGLNYNSSGTDPAKTTTTIDVPTFNISDNVGLLRVESTAPIKLVKSPDGRLQASAKLKINNTELPQLQNLMRAFGTDVSAQTPQGAQVRGGIVTGTIDIGSVANNQLQVLGNLAANGITIVVPNAQGLQGEQMTVAVQVRAADDLSTATVDKLDANASFLNAHVGDTELVLKEGTGPNAKSASTVDMLSKATVKIDVPSLPKLMLVKDAFSAPTATAPEPAGGKRGQAAAPAEQPTTVSKGTATITLNATRTGDKLSIIPNAAIRDLVLHKPDGDANIGNIDVSAKELALLINPSSVSPAAPSVPPSTQPATQPSIMDQVRELQVGQLVAALTGAQLTVNGSVQDLGSSRRLQNMGADLNYDASKLWTIILPMLSKKSQQDFKDAKVAGVYTKHITIGGSYPANDPNAIAHVVADGGFTLDTFDGAGATLTKLDLPFTLNGGIFTIAYANKPQGQNLPAPASLNGGTFDLGGIVADLKDPHMRVDAPAGKKLLSNVSLNPTFSHLFGDYINNPMFVTANQAAGQLDITINQCKRFPLDNLVLENAPANDGVLDLAIVLNKVQLGNQTLSQIAQQIASARVFGGNTLSIQSLQGDIPKLHVHIEHGVTTQEMTMTFGQGQRPLNLNGTVTMATKQMNMTLDLPWNALGVKNTGQTSFLSSGGIAIPLTGTITDPQFNAAKAVQENLAKQPQDLLKGLLGGAQGNNGNQPSSQPANDNPINQLENLLGGNKKKKK